MTDKDSSLHVAALQALEAALDAHRRTQAGAGASMRPDAAEQRSRRAWPLPRLWGLRKPGWRLPFNPWFMFDRRHPVMRRATVIGLSLLAVVIIACGAVVWRLSSG